MCKCCRATRPPPTSYLSRTDASTTVAVVAAAAAAAFPPEALPPADFQPSSPVLEVEAGAVVDAGEGVTGTGGGAFALPLPFAADPDAGGGVAGGAPPPLPPPLEYKNIGKTEQWREVNATLSNETS